MTNDEIRMTNECRSTNDECSRRIHLGGRRKSFTRRRNGMVQSTTASGNTSRLVMCAMCNAMHCVEGTRWRFAQKLQSYDCQNGGDAAGACNRLLNHAGSAGIF